MKLKLNYRSIATHSLVAAIFVNPYLLFIAADIHRLLTNNKQVPVVDSSLIEVMSLLSFTALVVSLAAFSVGTTPRKRMMVGISVGLVIAGWTLSQIFAPLGLLLLAIAAAILVFGVMPSKR